jgi:hypothetical protein
VKERKVTKRGEDLGSTAQLEDLDFKGGNFLHGTRRKGRWMHRQSTVGSESHIRD